MNKSKLTFDKSATKWMMGVMGKKIINKSCQFCQRKITTENLAGYDSSGAFCGNMPCLVQLVMKNE